MKNNILHIIFGIVFLVSCTSERSGEDADTPRGSRSLMTVEVLVDGADEHDYVRTARFVVFDNASVVPTVDINELITLEAKIRILKNSRLFWKSVVTRTRCLSWF